MAYKLSDRELNAIISTIRQNVAKTESTPTQPSEAYLAVKKRNELGPEVYKTILSRGETNAKKLDMQKKKEDRMEEQNPVDSVQIKRDRTSKDYESYTQKQKTETEAGEDRNDRRKASGQSQQKAGEDPVERRLRAEMEQAEKEYNEAEDKKRFEADMEVINGLSEEDRKLLETYSASKYSDRELPDEDLVDSLLEDFGRERLDELERTYSRYRNAKYAEEVDAKAREFVSKGYGRGILANILSVPVQAYTGIIGTGGQLAEMTKGTGGYKTMDPNAYGTIGQTFTGAIREQTAENINEAAGGGLWGTLASAGYQGVMAMADNIARVFLGGGALGGAGLAAMGSFSQAMADASRQGATPAQAALMATGTAFIEAATEKLPLDNLIKIAKGKGGVSVALNVLRQVGIEILEEEASLVGTLLLEAGVMQEKSGYNEKVNDLIVNGGLTPEQAKEQAAKDLFWEVINTALVSGIAGGLGGFGAVKANENGLIPADAEDAETQGKQYSEAEQETETKQEQQKAQEKQAEAEAARAVLEAVAQEHAAKVPKSQPQPVSEGMRHVNNAAAAINNVAPQQQAPVQQAPVAQPVQNPVQSKPKETPKPVQSQQQATVQQPVQAPQTPAVQPVQTVQTQQSAQTTQPVQPVQTAQNPKTVQPSQPVQPVQPQMQQNPQTAAQVQQAQTQPQAQAQPVQQPQAVQKEAPKKGKKIYFHFDWIGNHPFFNESQGGSREDLNFSINDDNSIDLDTTGQGDRYKNISGWMENEGLGKLYNVYADGQLVTNPKAASGYYSLAKAEVTARPVLQKLVGGNLIPDQKGEIHFYSDNFDKSSLSNRNVQPVQQQSQIQPAPAQQNQQAPAVQRTTEIEKAEKEFAEINQQFGYKPKFTRPVDPDKLNEAHLARGSGNNNMPPSLNGNRPETNIGKALFQIARFPEKYGGRRIPYNESKQYLSRSGVVADAIIPLGDGIYVMFGSPTGSSGYESVHYQKDAYNVVPCVIGENNKMIFDGNGESFRPYDSFDREPREYFGISKSELAQLPIIQKARSDYNEQLKEDVNIRDALYRLGDRTPEYIDATRPLYDKFVRLEQEDLQNQEIIARLEEEYEEPGIKGTGAAEQNFSEKPAYNATLSEDNAQADRRDDVRPMELPKQDIQGDNISAVTGNVYGSKITSDELASLMEEPTAKGDFTYAKISNDQATQKATETIAKAGTWEKAYDSWKQSVSAGNAGAEMSARGALFLNHAAQQGNKQLWLETLHYMQKLGTNTAQGLQAFRIIRSLNAPDKIEFAKMSVQKMVDELHYDVQIDEKLLDDYENAKTDEERDRILSDIQQNVADQIPSTILDKLNALRYMNMLGNLKTNVRNVLGNAGSAIVYRMKDQIATSLEKIAGTERTKSHTVSKALLNACKQDFEQVKSTVNSGGKYSDKSDSSDSFRQGVMDKRKIFKNPLLESYRKGTNWMMNNAYFGDEAFGKAAYARALAGYLKANGVKDTDLTKVDAKLLDKARAYAVQQAQEATFKDNSALAQIVTGIQKQTGIVGQGLMPFTKTPANVLTRAVEYSPLGIIDSTIKTVKAKKNTDITGADIVNSWAKTMTGTALFALGAALQDQGLLVGGPDDDEEKAEFDELNGRQNYAFSLPDGTSYTLDWMTPAAMPMFMGAQMWKIWTDDKDVTFADLENVFTSIADPMIQMSMLQGLNDSLASIKHSDNNLGQFLMNAAVSYLTQGLTNTLLGQLERSTEENRQTTYVDKDSSVPEWMQRALGKASQKIPGWDFQQQDYVNAWGETEKNEGGVLYNLLSPGYISKEKADQLTEELNRIHKETGENVYPTQAQKTVTYTDKDGTTHTDYNLTGEQYQTMQRVQGETYSKIASELISSKNYNTLSDEQKAEAFKLAYQYAREKAEQAALPDSMGYSESWMMEVKDGKEAEYIINKVGTAMLSGAMGKLDAAWDNGYSKGNQQALSEQLRQDYDSYKALDAAARRTIYEASSGTTRKYLEARSKGVSHDDFLKAAKAVNDVNGTGKYDPDTRTRAVRDIDTREAIARTPGISPATKDAIMRAYMPDYDPKASSPDYTELKYAYIREKLKLSPQEYARTYRAVLDNPKDGTDDDVLVDMGYDPEIARTLAGIYNSTKAGKAAYMDYYNRKK